MKEAIYQRIKDLAVNSTPNQLAYLAKSLELIADKKAISDIVQMAKIKEIIDALQKRLKDLAANSTPDQLAYLAKALESIVDKSAVSEIVQMTDSKLKELLDSAKKHLNDINSNKTNSISAITEVKTESVNGINKLRDNSLNTLKASSDSHISLLDTRKNANIAAINSISNSHKDGLKGLVEDFRAVNNVPPGSSIIGEIETRIKNISNEVKTRDEQLKASLINEIRKRNMVEPGSLPFLFGVLSRYNDSDRGHGYFKSDLGQWYNDTTKTDHMLSLLAGAHSYETSYVGFYRPPSIYFLQGRKGTFIYRGSYTHNTIDDAVSYPYALLGVIFVKNTTKADITRTLNFVGSSYWESGYEGAGMFVGIPDNTNVNKGEISKITWKNIYSHSSSSTGFSHSSSIITPAGKTVAILFYSSSYFYARLIIRFQFMQWGIYNFRSNFLTTGLEVDVERTLKAWQCPGLANTYEIWR